MKYSDFKELVINNMPDNPNPVLWQNKRTPKAHFR